MPIDMSRYITADFFLRWMSVAQLRDILSNLDDNDVVVPNRVGNLTIFQGGIEGEYKGYVDFNGETFDPVNEIDDEVPS